VFGSSEGGIYKPPLQLIQTRKRKYANSPEQIIALLGIEGCEHVLGDFVDHEKVRAAVAVPLWVSDSAVGVMFIIFRRNRKPPYEEKTIEALASLAAVAIRNLRNRKDSDVALSAATVSVSGIREYLTERTSVTLEDREFLTRQIDEIASQLEILRSVCACQIDQIASQLEILRSVCE